MSILADFITAIDKLVPGTLPLDSTYKAAALNQALKVHSKNRPQFLVEDIPGDGGFDYPIGNLLQWEEGFSGIKKIEYPVDDNEPIPNPLQEDEWTLYSGPMGKFLRFLELKPYVGETIRVSYTAIQAVTDINSTVATFDEEAIQALAAAFFCEMLSTYFAQNQDSTIHADSVSHTSKSRDYAARAQVYRKVYFDHFGIKEGETVAASITMDQDLRPSWITDKITHPKRWR